MNDREPLDEYRWDFTDRFDDCRPEMMPPPDEHALDEERSVSGELDETYERDDGWPFG